jgi:regulator of protease activity HflC (stomatin/prohibitin superfamily)
MPILFTITIIIALIGIGWAIFAPSDDTENLKVAAVIPLGIAFLLFVISVLTIVPTREIGVVTSFGRPVDTYSNGIHLKAPWEKVHKLDGTIQTDNWVGKEYCTEIRIGNESTACVDNTIRWRIRLEAGKRLYQDYREMDNIRESLVTRELKASLNSVLANFNPLEQIKADSKGAPDLNQFSAAVTRDLRTRVGDDVEIKSVIIPIIHFDEQTQNKINAYQAEVANTRIAEQKITTNKAQAKANEALKESVSNEPLILAAQCMDILDAMVKKNMTPPIGFNCIAGASATSVVIPKP